MPRLLFLQDVVAHLLDISDLSNTTSDKRRALRSAIWGFEQASTRHQWNFYDTEEVFTLNAPYEQEAGSTLAIGADGTCTLTGHSTGWPSWAEEGSLVFEDELYRVGTRVSSSAITLEDWRDTVYAPTSFKLVHNRKLLTSEPRAVYGCWNETDDCELAMVQPQIYRDNNRWNADWGGVPNMATIRADQSGGMLRYELRVAPFPEIDTVIDLAFVRRPTQPRWYLSAGTVSTAAAVATVSTDLPIGNAADLVGAWLRISTENADPGAEVGYGVVEGELPYFESPITVVTDRNTVTTLGTASPAADGEVGVITDVLDIPDFLFTAVLLYAEANMQRIAHGDMNKYAVLMQAADEQMRYAMEQGWDTKARWSGGRLRVGRLGATTYIVEA